MLATVEFRRTIPVLALFMAFIFSSCANEISSSEGGQNLAKLEGDQQSAIAGSTVAVAPAVIVTDGRGRALAGVNVVLQISGGGGVIDGGK
jgi:hypothetical protein